MKLLYSYFRSNNAIDKPTGLKKIQYPNLEDNHPSLNVIRLLSSLPTQFPDAISLSSGRPSIEYCQPSKEILPALETFKQHAEKSMTIPYDQLLGQYGNTKGFIQELVAKHLLVDEKINVNSENIIITSGFQEGAVLCVQTLFNKNDVLLVPDPIFNGITASALMHRVSLKGIPCTAGLQIPFIENAIYEVKKSNKNPKAIYVIPDFSNPQGECLSLQARIQLLELADKYNLYLIEDNAYSFIRFDDKKIPSLKSLDKNQRVIYVGTFAKSMYPSLRVGYIVADQSYKEGNNQVRLMNQLATAKSLITVNTPGIMQAIAGGILLRNHFSLLKYNQEKVASYKKNRDLMLKELERVFPKDKNLSVSWNQPSGGFFLTLHLPFQFNYNNMIECAKEFGVIVLPITIFSLNGLCQNQVRLSFASVSPDKITEGLNRLHSYIKSKMELENVRAKQQINVRARL